MASAAPSSNLQKKQTVAAQAAHGAAEVTRRMICGGLAGMIAKVSKGIESWRISWLKHNGFIDP